MQRDSQQNISDFVARLRKCRPPLQKIQRGDKSWDEIRNRLEQLLKEAESKARA